MGLEYFLLHALSDKRKNLLNMPSARADDDGNYNTEACGWDGGDCCACTCSDTNAFACGAFGYDCKDPSSPDCGEGRRSTVIHR